MPYVVAAIALALAGMFGTLWWDAKHEERPVLPPSFIESRIKQASLVPVTEQISKVYAVCPKDKGLFGVLGGSPKYVMSWTARVNYSIDLTMVKITEKPTTGRVTWVIEAPEIGILNEGSNLIDDKDHYRFTNEALIAKSKNSLDEHYNNEKHRANEVALYTANWRIKNDDTLLRDIEDQLKLVLYSQIAQLSDENVAFDSLEVTIAESTKEVKKPNAPSLCEAQPFKTNLGLTEL